MGEFVRSYTFRRPSKANIAKQQAYARAGMRAKKIDQLLADAPPLRAADIERWRAQLGRHPRVEDLVFEEKEVPGANK